MILLDGKKLRDQILEELKLKVTKEKNDITLAIMYIGYNEASEVYIKNKIKYAEMVGIKTKLIKFDENVKESVVIDSINNLNNDKNIHGIIIQSPISKHLDFKKLSNLIDSSKDVDGFTTENVYKNYQNLPCLLPCTVKGIIRLLDRYNIDIKGKNVTIVGRGMIVGKPLLLALLNKDATVTIAHSKTSNLKRICQNADILISAVGKNNLIKEDFVKEQAVVVDVGINKVDGKLCGDVDFENVCKKCSYITPVPGGVGPMTIAMLLENTYDAYKVGEKNG